MWPGPCNQVGSCNTAYARYRADAAVAQLGDKPNKKRGRPMKTKPSGAISETPIPPPVPPMQQPLPPQTPQSQTAPLPAQPTQYTPSQASPPPKTTPTKSTLKALPTVRDHTTDQLG